MKALIFCGGYGKRLGEVTRELPKPMVKIAGRPVIEHIINRLQTHGIKDIIINIHYLPMAISEHIGDRALYYYVPKLLGHQGTIFALRSWIGESDFMVINGDTISDLNYSLMKSFHKKNTITAYMDEWMCAGTWIYSPLYFENQSIPVLPYREPASRWFDIGTPEKLEEARKYFENS